MILVERKHIINVIIVSLHTASTLYQLQYVSRVGQLCMRARSPRRCSGACSAAARSLDHRHHVTAVIRRHVTRSVVHRHARVSVMFVWNYLRKYVGMGLPDLTVSGEMFMVTPQLAVMCGTWTST